MSRHPPTSDYRTHFSIYTMNSNTEAPQTNDNRCGQSKIGVQCCFIMINVKHIFTVFTHVNHSASNNDA